MKTTILILFNLLFVVSVSLGQEVRKETFQVKNASRINLDFKYPELVKLETWDKNEVEIIAELQIDGGESNDDFKLESHIKGGELTISSYLKNVGKHRDVNIYINDDDNDGETVTISRNGKKLVIGDSNNGLQVSIVLKVKMPKHIELNIDSQFGMVEVIDIPKSLFVKAKFGGADIAMSENSINSLRASTSWGQIYSNLSDNVKIGGNDMLGKEMIAELSNGRGGKSVKVNTEFGNVFLRKSKK